MCFVHDDYAWYAMVSEHKATVATSPMKCDECEAPIAAGDFVYTVFQQEHEECQACADGLCDCPREDPNDEDSDRVCSGVDCRCSKPNFGETFDYCRCEGCDKFILAIEAAELEEGCRKSEARPGLPMWYDLQGNGRDEVKRYWKFAAKMFPELVTSGHLAKLWKRAF